MGGTRSTDLMQQVLSEMDHVHVKVILLPSVDLTEVGRLLIQATSKRSFADPLCFWQVPLKRFYRSCLTSKLSFDEAGSVLPRSSFIHYTKG